MALGWAFVAAASVWFFQLLLLRWSRRQRRRWLRALGAGLRPPGSGLLFHGLWLAWTALAALTGWLTGAPALGTGVGLAFPLGMAAAAGYRRARWREELERGAVAFLHGLRGLVGAGVALPTALFALCRHLPGRFSRALGQSLGAYARGRSLSACLGTFRTRAALVEVGLCLDVVDGAYRNGLPVLPFLDRFLPWWEEQRDRDERWRSVRRSVLGQVILAAGLPWGVLGMLATLGEVPAGEFPGLLAAVGCLQAAGAGVLWRWCRFY